jgi:hypothetical protein
MQPVAVLLGWSDGWVCEKRCSFCIVDGTDGPRFRKRDRQPSCSDWSLQESEVRLNVATMKVVGEGY